MIDDTRWSEHDPDLVEDGPDTEYDGDPEQLTG